MRSRFWLRGPALIFLVVFLALLHFSCAARIKSWSQEAFRYPEFDIENLEKYGLAVFPVMVLEQATPKGNDREITQSQAPRAPYTPERLEGPETRVRSEAHTGSEAYRLGVSEILFHKVRVGGLNVRIVSPGECLKCINDSGLTDIYMKFDREFYRVGTNTAYLASFSQALNCRYLLVTQAVFSDYSTDTSMTFIWTLGRKSVLRSVKLSGQIWDAKTGEKVWEGYSIGFNRLVPYEGTPLLEEMVTRAVEDLVNSMIPAEPEEELLDIPEIDVIENQPEQSRDFY